MRKKLKGGRKRQWQGHLQPMWWSGEHLDRIWAGKKSIQRASTNLEDQEAEAAGLRARLGGSALRVSVQLFSGLMLVVLVPLGSIHHCAGLSHLSEDEHTREQEAQVDLEARLALPKIDPPFLALAPMTQGVRWRSVHTT